MKIRSANKRQYTRIKQLHQVDKTRTNRSIQLYCRLRLILIPVLAYIRVHSRIYFQSRRSVIARSHTSQFHQRPAWPRLKPEISRLPGLHTQITGVGDHGAIIGTELGTRIVHPDTQFSGQIRQPLT